MSTLGERIKYAREQKKILQADLAKLISVKSAGVISNWEKDLNKPDAEKIVRLCDVLNVSASYLLDYYGKSEFNINLYEQDYIKKYRFISQHSPEGAEVVNYILGREYSIAENNLRQNQALADMQKQLDSLSANIIEPDSSQEQATTLIELQPYRNNTFYAPYFRGGISAGSGIFILGNEATDEIEIPDIPKYNDVDYALDVNGRSMEPDYVDGDIVLVSQGKEMNPGDVGVFIIDGSAYIKEMGHAELISKNKDFPNIPIHESNNVVCMGKVIGKLERNKR